MQARLAIMRAARQLAIEADIHIMVRNFNVINQADSLPTPYRFLTDSLPIPYRFLTDSLLNLERFFTY